MFIGTENDILTVENVRTTVKSGGHMSDQINKKCLFGNKLIKITGFVSMTHLKPGFYKTLQQPSTEDESVSQI